jgi:hypothetical protein
VTLSYYLPATGTWAAATNAGLTTTITLDNGVYDSLFQIDYAIKYYLRENGDYIAGDVEATNTYPFTVGSNSETGKTYILCDTGVVVDLSNYSDLSDVETTYELGTSLLYDNLGFESSQMPLTDTVISTYNAGIGGDVSRFYIHCNLVSSLSSGEMRDVVYDHSFLGSGWTATEYPISTAEANIPCTLIEGLRSIEYIHIRITNGINQLLEFEGVKPDDNITLRFLIKGERKVVT